MTSGLAIEAKGLFKAFDGKTAVDGIDLAVPEGSIYGILGPNGAGKTTTLRMLLGIIDPDRGRAHRCSATRGRSKRRSQVGYLPEERGLYPAMTTREAVAFMGALRGLPLAVGRAPRRGTAAGATASPIMSTSRSGASPRAWPRPCNCSAPSSIARS